jgi:bifunctional UDP-N-acetylglucosamine pyrophosphorylase/glucosamine-1-phosphate N-acetyltransferase
MKLLELHRYEGNACTLVTCDFSDPTGYGRIERDDKGAVINIIEHKDASKKQRTIKEINSGIYLVNPTPLFEALHTLKNNNAQGEYYLTDIVPAMLKKGLRVGGLKLNEPLEIAGVNSIAELEALEKEYLRRIKTKNI